MNSKRMYKLESDFTDKTIVSWFWLAYMLVFGFIGYLIGHWILN